MPSGTRDHYKVLQVDVSADFEVIEAAYKRLARKYHPDVNKSADATVKMQELNQAYAVLKDPVKRARYDSQRGYNQSSSSQTHSSYTYQQPPREEPPTQERPRPESKEATPKPTTADVYSRIGLYGSWSLLITIAILAIYGIQLVSEGKPTPRTNPESDFLGRAVAEKWTKRYSKPVTVSDDLCQKLMRFFKDGETLTPQAQACKSQLAKGVPQTVTQPVSKNVQALKEVTSTTSDVATEQEVAATLTQLRQKTIEETPKVPTPAILKEVWALRQTAADVNAEPKETIILSHWSDSSSCFQALEGAIYGTEKYFRNYQYPNHTNLDVQRQNTPSGLVFVLAVKADKVLESIIYECKKIPTT